MGVEVRTIVDDEIEAWTSARNNGFMRPAAEGAADFMREAEQDLDRCWAGFDGSSVVATLRSFATPLTLPGGEMVPTAALTSVTAKPTHRRQGLLTRMITPDLDNAAERGEVAGILIAAEWPIYGRFGYGSAADRCQLKLDVPRTRFLREATGTVEMVDAATARRECPAIYDRFQEVQPGAIERDGRWWDIATRIKSIPGFPLPERFWVLCRDKRGKVVGYVSYAVDDHWVDGRPENTATLGELVGVDEEATLRLWQYLAQIDWVQTITASDRSVDDPLHWQLHDGRALRAHERTDFLWVRPLDVPGLLSARRYPVEQRVVFEIVDDMGWAAGRFALDGGPDGATCKRVRTRPDLTFSASSLGAVSLGGVSVATLVRAGQVEEHRAGAAARADAFFRWPVTPWCNTWF
jgi:predicted acetyltransferase